MIDIPEHLLGLERAAWAALSGDDPDLKAAFKAAWAFHEALVEHVEAAAQADPPQKINRYELEMAVKREVRHTPAPA